MKKDTDQIDLAEWLRTEAHVPRDVERERRGRILKHKK